MKTKEASSLVQLIRETKLADLFLLSIIILPIYLTSWNILLRLFDENLWNIETEVLIGLVLIYIVALLIMKFGQSKEEKYKTALQKIIRYYKAKGWVRMSYTRIKNSIDPSYDEQFLKNLVDKFPTEIRSGNIKGGNKGIFTLDQEEETR